MLTHRKSRSKGPQRQRGFVLFVSLVLLLVLTILAISLARTQTVEERLATNEVNHQMALQTAEAALQAGFDNDAGGIYTDFSGATAGLDSIYIEMPLGSTLPYSTTWTPGVDAIGYNGTALSSAPANAGPAFVLEAMTPVAPIVCGIGNSGNYGNASITIHRITAHSAGGDGTASATVQTIHVGGC